MKKSLLILYIIFYGLKSYSQGEEYANQVSRLFYNLPERCRILPLNLPDTSFIFTCQEIAGPVSLRIRMSLSDHRLLNLGFAVFNDQQLTYDNDILSFCERLMLEVITNSDPVLKEKRLHELKSDVRFKQSLLSDEISAKAYNIYDFQDGIENIAINRDSLNYEVIIRKKECGELKLKFPADIQIISGFDKIELDRALEREIKYYNYSGNDSSIISLLLSQNVPVAYKKDLFRISGRQFSPLIIPDIYLNKNDEIYNLVFEKSFPKESLANIMLLPSAHNKMVNLDWKIYGTENKIVRLNLHDLVGFFVKNGFKNYIGFEQTDKGSIAASVIYYNPKFNYMHLLAIRTNENDPFNDAKSISGKFYTFIPTNNIKDLFKKHEEGPLFNLEMY